MVKEELLLAFNIYVLVEILKYFYIIYCVINTGRNRPSSYLKGSLSTLVGSNYC